MSTCASAAYVSLALFIIQIEHPSLAGNVRTNLGKKIFHFFIVFFIQPFFPSLSKWQYASSYQLVESSDDDVTIEINLNINLNGISNGTDGVEIVNEPKSLVKSRSASGNVKIWKLM